jgi:hypothetical protein
LFRERFGFKKASDTISGAIANETFAGKWVNRKQLRKEFLQVGKERKI